MSNEVTAAKILAAAELSSTFLKVITSPGQKEPVVVSVEMVTTAFDAMYESVSEKVDMQAKNAGKRL